MSNRLLIKAKRNVKQFLLNRNIVALHKSRYGNCGIALARAVKELLEYDTAELKPGGTGVIFSKDRPLQLHGLLRTCFELIEPVPKLKVIIGLSGEEYKKAYLELESLFSGKDIEFIFEDGFRNTLIQCLDSIETEKLFFLVDDILFTRSVNFQEFLDFDIKKQVPSLRLAPHLTHCYTSAARQKLPNFNKFSPVQSQEKRYTWNWGSGEYDWSYALSVDGHCFSTREMRIMGKLVDFVAPNSFEIALQCFQALFLEREGICYEHSRIVNIPFNKVQKENKNIAANVNSEQLLNLWNEGYALDVSRYRDVLNKSAHQEMKLHLCKRET